jgi:hypothetical protein
MKIVTPDLGERPTYTVTPEQQEALKNYFNQSKQEVRAAVQRVKEAKKNPPQIKTCADHKSFKTQKAAEEVLSKVALRAAASGRDEDSWKLLSVFPCGDHFHIGRNWRKL